MRIIYYGTPDFAVPSLEALIEAGHTILAVVTIPDKPAGRGLKLQSSPVKECAVKHSIPVLQPVKLSDPEFIEQLKKHNPELQVVVAFRKLPEAVWSLPTLGTFNLHGSILPDYRGAAPINHAVINGEKETGVTTFFIERNIDTGKILFCEKIPIAPDDTAGDIHDRLMEVGASLVVKTVTAIENEETKPVSQEYFYNRFPTLHDAPKLTKDFCRVKWNRPVNEIHNLIRGLCPYPASYTTIESPEGQMYSVKLFKSAFELDNNTEIQSGTIETTDMGQLRFRGMGGWLQIKELQLEGKKKMLTEDFLRGFKMQGQWRSKD